MDKKVISIDPNVYENYMERTKIFLVVTNVGKLYITHDQLDLDSLTKDVKFLKINSLVNFEEFLENEGDLDSREKLSVTDKIEVLLPVDSIGAVEVHKIYKSRIKYEK